MLEPVFEHWPSTTFVDGSADTASLTGADVFPIRYLNAFGTDRAMTLWLADPLLGEIRGHSEAEARLEWYAQLGVPLLSEAEVAALKPSGIPATGLERAALLDAMLAHLQTVTTPPLERARRLAQGRLGVVSDGVRLELLAWDRDWVCRATADGLEHRGGEPRTGCWSRP
jgi:hypothetical protein